MLAAIPVIGRALSCIAAPSDDDDVGLAADPETTLELPPVAVPGEELEPLVALAAVINAAAVFEPFVGALTAKTIPC